MTSNFTMSLQSRLKQKKFGVNLTKSLGGVVKVRGLEMAKILEKLHIPFKIVDFLCELEHGSRRLFCRSEAETSVTQRSSLFVKA